MPTVLINAIVHDLNQHMNLKNAIDIPLNSVIRHQARRLKSVDLLINDDHESTISKSLQMPPKKALYYPQHIDCMYIKKGSPRMPKEKENLKSGKKTRKIRGVICNNITFFK